MEKNAMCLISLVKGIFQRNFKTKEKTIIIILKLIIHLHRIQMEKKY